MHSEKYSIESSFSPKGYNYGFDKKCNVEFLFYIFLISIIL